jgi:transcriptional regulator with XRE-family HTH domain
VLTTPLYRILSVCQALFTEIFLQKEFFIMTMYERIETMRKSVGISQGKLEKELGFSNGSISKWKNSTPTPDRLQKLADFFGVSVDYLIKGEENEEKGYYINPETAELAQTLFENKDLRVLFDAAKDATPEDLQTTYNMLMALKKKERGIID